MPWEREDLDALADATGEQRALDRSEAEHDFGYGPAYADRVADLAPEPGLGPRGGDPAHRRASAA
jgi:hypothetical protein